VIGYAAGFHSEPVEGFLFIICGTFGEWIIGNHCLFFMIFIFVSILLGFVWLKHYLILVLFHQLFIVFYKILIFVWRIVCNYLHPSFILHLHYFILFLHYLHSFIPIHHYLLLLTLFLILIQCSLLFYTLKTNFNIFSILIHLAISTFNLLIL
jgi:hypothetical protein